MFLAVFVSVTLVLLFNCCHIETFCDLFSFFLREYLATFKKTVAMHEVFLCRLVSHPVFRNDHNLRVFLEYDQVCCSLSVSDPHNNSDLKKFSHFVFICLCQLLVLITVIIICRICASEERTEWRC